MITRQNLLIFASLSKPPWTSMVTSFFQALLAVTTQTTFTWTHLPYTTLRPLQRTTISRTHAILNWSTMIYHLESTKEWRICSRNTAKRISNQTRQLILRNSLMWFQFRLITSTTSYSRLSLSWMRMMNDFLIKSEVSRLSRISKNSKKSSITSGWQSTL